MSKEGIVWNTLFMHLVDIDNTMYIHLGDGGWTFREVHEYTLRRLRRGDFAYESDADREAALRSWLHMQQHGFFFTAFGDARLKTQAAFGIYEYGENENPQEAGMEVAGRICEQIAKAGNWKHAPKTALSDDDNFAALTQGVLDMRLDLLASSTGVPRTSLPIGTTKGLLEQDDAITETFEYLLGLQKLPGIPEKDYREASYLLYLTSLLRYSLWKRIEREGIHVESDPDLRVNRKG